MTLEAAGGIRDRAVAWLPGVLNAWQFPVKMTG